MMTLGEIVKYRKNDDPKQECRVEGVRLSGTTISNDASGESWPGVQFLMQPVLGGKRFWTVTMPAKDGLLFGAEAR